MDGPGRRVVEGIDASLLPGRLVLDPTEPFAEWHAAEGFIGNYPRVSPAVDGISDCHGGTALIGAGWHLELVPSL